MFALSGPSQTLQLFAVWNESHVSQCLVLLEFFPLFINISPIIDQYRYFFYLCDKALILKLSLNNANVSDPKRDMGPSIFEVWSKNIFSQNVFSPIPADEGF